MAGLIIAVVTDSCTPTETEHVRKHGRETDKKIHGQKVGRMLWRIVLSCWRGKKHSRLWGAVVAVARYGGAASTVFPRPP